MLPSVTSLSATDQNLFVVLQNQHYCWPSFNYCCCHFIAKFNLQLLRDTLVRRKNTTARQSIGFILFKVLPEHSNAFVRNQQNLFQRTTYYYTTFAGIFLQKLKELQ